VEELKEIYHVYGRETKMGAYTGLEVVKVFKGTIKVCRLNFSKSGRHWEEVLLASPDAEGVVHYVNISNSGKHYCKILLVKGSKVEVVDEAKGRCPIHYI